MTTEAVEEELNTDIVPAGVLDQFTAGKIKDWKGLVAALAPPPEPVKVGLVPSPTAITPVEEEALKLLPSVYGSVIPTERRELTPEEVSALLVERANLKVIEALIKRRVDDIALTVLNHNDVDYEENEDLDGAILGPDGKPWYTDKGHVVRKRKIPGDDPAIATEFSIETRQGTPSCDPAALKKLGADPDVDYFTHKDYLAMTTQVRVFDDAKAILAVRSNPELLRAIRAAATTSAHGVSVYQRNK